MMLEPTPQTTLPETKADVQESTPALPPAGNGVSTPAAEVLEDAPTIISKSLRSHSVGEANNAGLLQGRRLAHFELEEAIGVGGMAAVIRARDLHLDRTVALKILPPEMAGDPENVRRFQQEARAAAKLDHENIARVYFCGEDQGLHFIAFEFVEGQNLRALIDHSGHIPVAEAVHYVLQIAKGLVHAAERGVVHRDIKPSNIIVGQNGRARLVDMGLARSLEPRGADKALTQSGVTLGTFDYISPEQALEPREADARSDIYSLGCTFYHMLTGRPPVPEGTAARKLQFHQQGSPTDPRLHNPEIPDEVAAILSKMMAKTPEQRYQRPEQLVQHLQVVAHELNGDLASPHSHLLDSILPRPPKVRPLATLVLGSLAVAALIGLMGLFSNTGPETLAQPPRAARAGDRSPSASTNKTLVPPLTIPDTTAQLSQPLENQANGEVETPESQKDDPVSPRPDAVRPETNTVKRPVETEGSSPPDSPKPPVRSPMNEITVDPQGPYKSLASALGAVESDEIVIILKVNGFLSEMPLEIRKKKKVTIRAAEGCRPVLVLDPKHVPSADGETALFRIHDEELVLERLDFRLQPLAEEAKLESLVMISGAGRCKLDQCVVTLEGSTEGPRLAAIAVTDPTGSMMGTPNKPPRTGIPAIELTNCFIRGRGDLVTIRSSRPYQLDVRNSLAALAGSFISVEGNKQGSMAMAGSSLSLQRVTAYVTGHVMTLRAGQSNPVLVPTEVTSANSCVFVNAESKALFYLDGPESDDEIKRILTWRGQMNYYSTTGAILVCQPIGTMAMTSRYNVSRWESLWGQDDIQPRFTEIKFVESPSSVVDGLVQSLPAHFKLLPADTVQTDVEVSGADVAKLPQPAGE